MGVLSWQRTGTDARPGERTDRLPFTRLILAALVAALGSASVAGAALSAQSVSAPLLPDLVQERPKDLGVERAGTRFRLGFWSGVSNTGAGPLIVEGTRPDPAKEVMTAAQVVMQGDGLAPERRDGVGELRYTRLHGHRHWHFQDFERYELRRDGRSVRPARKTGFCLGDRYDAVATGRLRGEPTRPPYTRFCGVDRPDLERLVEGISVGFGDDYAPQLEGQFVDVTGLPAGRYELVHRVNVDRRLLESRYDNNESCVAVTLRWPRGPRRAPAITTVPASPCTITPPRQEVG